MADPTTEFFEGLMRRGHDARVEKVDGTLGFDLVGDGCRNCWFVEVRRGDILVSREPRQVQCVLHSTLALFNKIVTGEDNAVAALLRGAVTADGDLRLLFQFQRLMAGPPGARDPRRRRAAGAGGQREDSRRG